MCSWRFIFTLLVGLQLLPAQAQIVYTGLSSFSASQQADLNRAKQNLERMLEIKAPVYIAVALDSTLVCGANSASLAYAGPNNVYRDAAGLPLISTWYPASLAVQLSTEVKTAQSTKASISAVFNPLTQAGCGFSWHYGSTAVPHGKVSFYDTAIHEIMHGLGFISFQSASGQWFSGKNDVFSRQLGTGSKTYPAPWVSQPSESAGKAAMQSNNVYWQGVKGQKFAELLSNSAGRPKMYAPSSYEDGSSISHFDTSTLYLSGEDEMMEPYASDSVRSHLSAAIFCDIGWALKTDYDGDGIDDCRDDQPLIAAPSGGEDPDQPPLPEGEDYDGDGIANEVDNCPTAYNERQLDADGNGTGDVCSPLASSGLAWGELKKQRFGAVLASAGDMNGDGYGDYWAASPKVAVNTGSKILKAAGAVHLMSGKSNQSMFDGAIIGRAASGHFGSQIIGNVDFDRDGCPDTFFSAPNETVERVVAGKPKKLKAAGTVYRYSPFTRVGDVCHWLGANLEIVYQGSQANAKAGSALLFVDDGVSEPRLLIAEPGRSNLLGQKRAGAVIAISESQTAMLFEGRAAGEQAGSALALGRYDGLQRLVAVAAPGIKQGTQRGGIYWLDMDGELTVNKSQPTLLPAEFKSCVLKGALATIRDGAGDILAAATPNCRITHAKQGAVWLFNSDETLEPLTWPQTKLGLGQALVVADVTGDDIDDLVVSSANGYIDPTKAKPVANSGSLFFYDPTQTPLYLNGVLKNEQFGCAMAAAYVDDDRRADLIVASCGAGQAALPQLGFVEIFLGRFFQR